MLNVVNNQGEVLVMHVMKVCCKLVFNTNFTMKIVIKFMLLTFINRNLHYDHIHLIFNLTILKDSLGITRR